MFRWPYINFIRHMIFQFACSIRLEFTLGASVLECVWCKGQRSWLHVVIYQICQPPTSIFRGWMSHTWYLSFFLHGQHFGRTLSPHRKCVNCDKTGFATKQRKLQQNRFCKKTVEKRSHIKIILSIYSTWYARANNSWNQTNFSTSKMSPHVKFLHI